MNARTEIATLHPIKPDTPDTARQFDETDGGFHLQHLQNMLSDCADQPLWRDEANLCAAYVDGKQLTEAQESALRAEGMEDVKPTNLIGRVVRSLLGTEARSRTDIKVEADDEEADEVCEVSNLKMAEAKRETYADQAVSNAYAGQVGPGIGWVEVARSADVLAYPYRVMDVHREEMWWDMRAKDVLLRDARWVVRKRWQDLDEMEAKLPQFKDLLRAVANNWLGFAFDNTLDEQDTMVRHWNVESRWANVQRRMDWYDSARKRVKLYEVWYRMPAIGVFLSFSPTRRVLFNPQNAAHVQAVNSGTVRIGKGPTDQVRMALFAGPHRLIDQATTKRSFPYVPFMAYRDDEDNSPYGVVAGMIAPQDEYNARRIRINWLLRSKQVIMDDDALQTKANNLADVISQVNRPDMTVILNSNRANMGVGAFRVESNLSLQKEQVDVMQDAKQNIQDVPGAYGSQLGQAASGVTSGIANSLLIEQGAVAQGDLNDNYRHGRRMVFEHLLDLIVEDHLDAEMQVRIGRGSTRRVVVLNHWDPEQGLIVNNMQDAPLRVGLGEVPSTPAFRAMQQQQVGNIIGSIAPASPQAAAVLAPAFIESTDLPNRMELADDVRRALNIPTAGDKKAAEAQAQQQAQDQAKAKQMQEMAMQLSLRAEESKVEETESRTQLNLAKVSEIGHDMALGEQAANKPEPVEAPDQETPEMANERMIEEAIAEARARRQSQPA